MSEPVKPPHVKVTNSSLAGWKTKVEINGQEISSWCQNVEVIYNAKGVNVVRIDVLAGSLEVESDALIELAAPAKGFLIQHGWTPPPDEPIAVA